jgi:uncharacterized membrane protein YGL010W
MEKLLLKHLSSYEKYHQNFVNRILHYIGVPLVYFGLLIFFNWIHIRVPNFFDTSLAWLLIVLLLIYYFFLDIIFGATLTVVFLILNLIAAYFAFPGPSWVSFQILLVTLIIGLILIGIGHVLEKKHPAFNHNLMHIIIAPVYITAMVFFCLGYRKELQQKTLDTKEIFNEG